MRRNISDRILGWLFVLSFFLFFVNLASYIYYYFDKLLFYMDSPYNIASILFEKIGYRLHIQNGNAILCFIALTYDFCVLFFHGLGISGVIQQSRRKIKFSAWVILGYAILDMMITLVFPGRERAIRIPELIIIVLMVVILLVSKKIGGQVSEVLSFESVLVNEGNMNGPPNVAKSDNQNELTRYDNLLAIGAITREEYEQQKARIMKNSD